MYLAKFQAVILTLDIRTMYNKVIMKGLTRIPFGVSYISDSDPGTHVTSKNAEQALKKGLQWNFYHPDRGPRQLD